MRDRVPTKPNRYAVYDDNHNFLRYEYHERADEPTEAGTPLTKATLLSDTTAAQLGLSGDPTVDDALTRLNDTGIKSVVGSYVGTGGTGSGNAIVLSFDFEPFVVGISAAGNSGSGAGNLIIRNQTLSKGFGARPGSTYDFSWSVSWGEKSVQWFSSDAGKMLNVSGTTYYYFALGY